VIFTPLEIISSSVFLLLLSILFVPLLKHNQRLLINVSFMLTSLASLIGIHFTASPRFADMLLVTGPVTRNMEIALRRTYNSTPSPKLVVAVGDCGCNGGIFG